MSGKNETTDESRQKVAAAFGRDVDPLAEYDPVFRGELADVDPFEMFMTDVVRPKWDNPSTISNWENNIDQYRQFMERFDRHPVCPNERHLTAFIDHLVDERGNQPKTVKIKLRHLGRIWEYWSNDPGFPHDTDYSPVKLARDKYAFSSPKEKTFPRLSIDVLRNKIDEVTNVRDKAIIVSQLKLGLRATELCNVKLAEIDLQHLEINDHYPDMGTADALDGRSNAIYIPHDRQGNKSKRPRVLPLDDELRMVLIPYLLMRPDVDRPWIFLSQQAYARIDDKDVNDRWKEYFHPKFAETENHEPVTSKLGRHRFTTFWRTEKGLNEELVKYMRGDKQSAGKMRKEGIDYYVHTYYEDIRKIYLREIFKLHV